jgi:hypothetical protein
MDAHSLFSMTIDLTGDLPELNLRVAQGMIEMIEMTMIPEQVNVPYVQLMAGMVANEGTPRASRGQESFEKPYSGGSGDEPVVSRHSIARQVLSRLPWQGPKPSTLQSGCRI